MTVIDSSVLVSIFSDEDKFHKTGLDIFSKILNKNIEATIPTLAVPEVCGAIRRNFGLHLAMVVDDKLNTLINSGLISVKELDLERMVSATEDTIRFNLKGADAVFVSLARELKSEFLTFDDEIKRKIKDKVKIFHLTNILQDV